MPQHGDHATTRLEAGGWISGGLPGCATIASMNTQARIEALYRPIEGELAAVRAVITGLWEDALRLVRVTPGALPKAGGKLLRPALCLLSAGSIGLENLHRYARMAAAFEALHLASLTHDDVIDRAFMRRGSQSLNALWDNHAAVLGGDYLVARAIEMLAEYDSCAIVAHAITSVRRMAEGELYFFGRESEPFQREDCIELARQKTASLFAEACAAPAYLPPPGPWDALHRFGESLGIAFQIVDDLIDLTQPAGISGKPACGDLAEGKQTLPIILLRSTLTAEETARIEGLRGGAVSASEQEWVARLLEERDIRRQTQAAAREFMDTALAALELLPPSRYRDAMAGLSEFILVRAS